MASHTGLVKVESISGGSECWSVDVGSMLLSEGAGITPRAAVKEVVARRADRPHIRGKGGHNDHRASSSAPERPEAERRHAPPQNIITMEHAFSQARSACHSRVTQMACHSRVTQMARHACNSSKFPPFSLPSQST